MRFFGVVDRSPRYSGDKGRGEESIIKLASRFTYIIIIHECVCVCVCVYCDIIYIRTADNHQSDRIPFFFLFLNNANDPQRCNSDTSVWKELQRGGYNTVTRRRIRARAPTSTREHSPGKGGAVIINDIHTWSSLRREEVFFTFLYLFFYSFSARSRHRCQHTLK
jgi:hypothetical protein